MRPKVKYQVIYRHQDAYPVSVMCTFFGVSRSGYYDYVKRINRPEKDAPLAALLRKQQEHCFQTYGYRRMHLWLERQGIHHNPKTVLKPATFSEANEMIDRYIHFYNHERIQLKTGEAPLARRLSY